MELNDTGKTTTDILQNVEGKFQNTSEDFLSFQNHSKPRFDVLEEVRFRTQNDNTYRSGKILGAMTTDPHEFARYVYTKYIERNLGDPGLIPGTKQIETELVGMIGSILGDPTVLGNMVSGGTEANLIAAFMAKKSHPEIKQPEIVVPDSAHYSFDKAAELMDIKIRRARLDDKYQIDLEHYESLVNENTIAAISVAGTTALGLVDPIKEIGKIARKNNLFYHVDGAFGGLILPFLKRMGHQLPEFDMSIPEIVSYTVDPHKMGMGVNPSGMFLVKNGQFNKNKFGFEIPYLAGGGFKSFNITGTRPGASAISFWALLQHLGQDGFSKIIGNCWKNTLYLKNLIEDIPEVEIATEPQTPVLGLKLTTPTDLSLCKFDFKLRERGWALGIFKQWKLARVVMMPHIKTEHLDAFVKDLKKIFV
jgi:tyrosine decarboxylase / aspartate 1-decarboxylase